MNIHLIIINVAVFSCYTAAWADESPADVPPQMSNYTYVDHEGYRYSYRTGLAGGVIEVTEPGTNKRIVRQSYLKPAGCPGSDFAVPREFNRTPGYYAKLVILCGEDKAHRSTAILFNQGERVAMLDYFYAKPNLAWHPEYSSYIAEVRYGYRRPEGGMDYLKMIYEYRTDDLNDSGLFYPVFNAHSYKLYRDEYDRLKKQAPVRYLSLLAELVATSKASRICSELDKPPLNQLSRQALQENMAINESYGFPSFDPTVCDISKKAGRR